jgi:hypothetical protein
LFHGYGTPLDISAEDVCFKNLRQFLLLRFTLPGGVARARGENGSAAPPVQVAVKSKGRR